MKKTGLNNILYIKTCVMTNYLLLCLAVMMMAGCGSGSQTSEQAGEEISTGDISAVAERYREDLARIVSYRGQLKEIHPVLGELYPVTIVVDDHFYVFDLDDGGHYVPVADCPAPMPVPEGVRAAFQIACYDNNTACVVTPDVFDESFGYATIFHEFIHCHQAATVEPALRQNLPLAQKALEEEDYMWEINHPFPYEGDFESLYARFMQAAAEGDMEAVKACRSELAGMLNDHDYQYMVWQEWKEGFALFLEQKIREEMGLGLNKVGRRPPFDRTAFYAGGAAWIDLLGENDPALLTDLEALFKRMMYGS